MTTHVYKRIEELCIDGKQEEALEMMKYWDKNWEAPFYLLLYLTFLSASSFFFIETLDFVSIEKFSFSPIFLLMTLIFTFTTIRALIWNVKLWFWLRKNKLKYLPKIFGR